MLFLWLDKDKDCLLLPLHCTWIPNQCIRDWWNTEWMLHTEYLCPPKCMCYNPKPQGDGIRKWGFGQWLSHEVEPSWTGLVLLSKTSHRDPLQFMPCEDTAGSHHLQPGRGCALELDCASSLVFNFQLPELGEINFCSL